MKMHEMEYRERRFRTKITAGLGGLGAYVGAVLWFKDEPPFMSHGPAAVIAALSAAGGNWRFWMVLGCCAALGLWIGWMALWRSRAAAAADTPAAPATGYERPKF